MSESPRNPHWSEEDNKVTFEEITGWLDEICPNYKCELCSHDRLELMTVDGKYPYLLQTDIIQLQDKVMRFYYTSCTRCGNTKHLAAHTVEAAIRERRAATNG